MREKGILFQARLINAIYQDMKWQTRRVGPGKEAWLKLRPGDVLYVRETWSAPPQYDATRPKDIPIGTPLWYWADGPPVGEWGKKRPGIFLPRWGSRLNLPVTRVPHSEPIQAISYDDCLAEGVDRTHIGSPDVIRNTFEKLWDSVNAARGYGWATNEEVAVITFERQDE